MRAVQLTDSGYVPVEIPRPEPGPGEALVRVRATSLNYRDLLLSKNPRQRRPIVPLSDGAGEVEAVGAGVTRVKAGDRVAANFFPTWTEGPISAEAHDDALGGGRDGMLAESVVLPASALVRLPDALSFEEAACLPCAGLTAWNALFETSRMSPGETVLLLGTGGVSVFALQLVKAAGGRAIVTSSSDEKLARARAMGADETVNYRETPEWDRRVWELTGGRGVDRVIEVGGAGTLERSLRATRHGGTVSLIGVLTEGSVDPRLVLGRSIRVEGIYVGSVGMFERLLRAVEANGLKPVIDRTFPMDEAAEALAYLETGAHFGKVVVTV